MKTFIVILLLVPCMAFAQKADTIRDIGTAYNGTQSVHHEVKCDNFYLSGLYFQKAGRNLIGGGVMLGISCLAAIAPNFLPVENRTYEVTMGCAVASGVFLIGSITEFIIAGHQLKQGGIILRSGKSYTIITSGNSFKIKF